MAKLTFILEDGQEIVVPVDERVSIGRRDGHDVVVDDLRVSSDHAEVHRAGKDFLVRDLGSKSGTFVNDVRIDELRLRDGDHLRFGPLRAVFDFEPSSVNGAESVKTRSQTTTKTKTTKKAAKKAAPDARDLLKKEVSVSKIATPVPKAATSAPPPLPPPIADLESGEAALNEMRADVAGLKTEIQQLVTQRTELQVSLNVEESTLRGVKQELSAVEARLRDARTYLQSKTERIAQLLTDEKRLEPASGALKKVEAKHEEWLASINALAAEHERKSAELHRLNAVSEAALREAEAVGAHKRDALEHLEHLAKERELTLKERELTEGRLVGIRKAVADAEQREKELNGLIQVREDQLRTSEKKIDQAEQRRADLERKISELAPTAEKLVAAADELKSSFVRRSEIQKEIESLSSRHGEHVSALKTLVQRIEEHTKASTEAENRLTDRKAKLLHEESALTDHQAKAGEVRNQLEAEKVEIASALQSIRVVHEAEKQRFTEVSAKREEIERQVQELAGVEDTLRQTRIALQKADSERIEAEAIIKVLEGKKAFLQECTEAQASEERKAKERLEVLIGREKMLQESLEALGGREQEERNRFEEVRRLSTEALEEHNAQQESLQRGIEITRRELSDLELKLYPLREWKDSMDKRYEKLAALPEDSAEARELWREIESQKANLRKLITVDPGQTRGIALSEAVLKGLETGNATRDQVAAAVGQRPKKNAKSGKPPSTEPMAGAANDGEASDAVPESGVVVSSGTGQEVALKGRLSKLRESVQREAARLEFLRQERSHEESRARMGSSANEALMKEHERQLEGKVRREEEKLATLQRKLELAEMEEERRRDKIAEMERKLAELKADIAEAERERSDARHQAEIAHAEPKPVKAGSERLKKIGNN